MAGLVVSCPHSPGYARRRHPLGWRRRTPVGLPGPTDGVPGGKRGLHDPPCMVLVRSDWVWETRAVLMPALALLTLRKPQAWAAVVASVPTAALMSVLGKHWSAVARPAAVLDASSFTLIGEALRYNSFPSGHSITVFAAAAAVLATLLPSPRTSRARLLLAAGVTVALMIALSRVAVGAHWLADVLAGGAGGWLAGLSGAALAAGPVGGAGSWSERGARQPARSSVCGVCCCCFRRIGRTATQPSWHCPGCAALLPGSRC